MKVFISFTHAISALGFRAGRIYVKSDFDNIAAMKNRTPFGIDEQPCFGGFSNAPKNRLTESLFDSVGFYGSVRSSRR